MNNRKFIAAISISALLFLSSCATNPVTGTPDFVTITEQQEISIGASYHEKILEENKVIENKELNDYFSKLGNEIARNSHRPDLKWTFTLIDSPTMNAFATRRIRLYVPWNVKLLQFRSRVCWCNWA